ncbi:MAG: carnitine-CoA ligase [Ilumatobacteraceae bacterium]|jgi:crotonobetaine/carnitine-CoA ligase
MDGAPTGSLEAALTIDRLLDRRASDSSDTVFLRFSSGELTFGDARRRSTGLAHGLKDLGVHRGQLVPVLMSNGPEFAITWLALCTLGAVSTLLNTEFRGPSLLHALNLSGAELVIVDARLVPNLAAVLADLVHVRTVVVVGGTPATADDLPGVRVIDHAALCTDDASVIASRHSFADPAMVLFTSGTTGPSKGCVLSHRYAVRQAELMIDNLKLRSTDVLYCPFPMFHIDATVLTVVPAMLLATTAAIGDRFSPSAFWDEVRAAGATVFDFMGATLTMLQKRPPRPDDADNPARLGWGVPVPEFAVDFERRFGVHLVELYGSTDAGIPMYHPVDVPRRQGSCGRAIPQYDVRLFDEWGAEVADDEVGELVVRPNEPSLMSDGYYGMPAASLESRRDLWFHTGDLARRDADGYFYFVGRRTDSIRRRGENISAFEVEEVVKLHHSVLDAAAFGVPSELTEDDVMIAVVVRPGDTLDPADLITFCSSRMARHMIPRYVDVVDTLPRTPTEKVEKARLRERGITATTWQQPLT